MKTRNPDELYYRRDNRITILDYMGTLMERKPGEAFDCDSTKLVAVPHKGCSGCVFYGALNDSFRCSPWRKILGLCSGDDRSDSKGVIFVPVEDL